MSPIGPVPVAISPMQLVIRYFAEKKNDQWQAFSLEFGLAVQADTLDEVRRKLEAMVVSYLEDILTVDKEHAKRLFLRRSTFSVRLKYHFYSARSKLRQTKGDRGGNVFRETLPLGVVSCPT